MSSRAARRLDSDGSRAKDEDAEVTKIDVGELERAVAA